MSEPIITCPVCHTQIEEGDLFCENCGRESPHRGGTRPPRTRIATHHFQCAPCGASMSYDASSGALTCPFCGSKRLNAKADSRVLDPERVVPFVFDQKDATDQLRAWLGRGFWRPGDLARQAMVVEMRPVYVPYWVFCAKIRTYWTADSNDLPTFSRGQWRPLFGEHQASYDNLLVGASGALSDYETRALTPFRIDEGLPRDQVDLESVTVEQFAVPRKTAGQLARTGLESLELAACQLLVPGRCRNAKVNPRIEGLSGEPVLLPVWIMAYRYRQRVFRFLVNGQTGQATGQAPRSVLKIAAAVAIGVVVATLIALTLVTAAKG